MTASDLIVGAGPAGLTAAYELLAAGAPPPVIIELDSQVGGISKTINYGGNRMDLGGHRFFSKSDWVMDWWQKFLPVAAEEASLRLAYQNDFRTVTSGRRATAADGDNVMLVRPRLSRIYYGRRFYDYPVKLNSNTIRNLGIARMARIGASYARARMVPRHPELSLEDFLINRFGRELYLTFFRDYTEKVWGVSCREISAEWGAQRIKGLSIMKALAHAARQLLPRHGSFAQKNVETSLIERFLYPKLGPGQLWEEVARRVEKQGAQLLLNHRVVSVRHRDGQITSVDVTNQLDGSTRTLPVRNVISTMPIKELAEAFSPMAPEAVFDIARAIPYRDFVTVGMLVDRMAVPRGTARTGDNAMPPDNWIYIQEPDVKLGRLQIFNNWSRAMVGDHPKVWLGLEYFCDAGDETWSMRNHDFIDFAAQELERIGMIERQNVLDATIVRVPKAYPAYFGAYAHMGRVREYFDTFPNLFLVGRNGMHRYNNQDHSMLSAKAAVAAILAGSADKAPIWAVNVDDEYHEEKTESPDAGFATTRPSALATEVS